MEDADVKKLKALELDNARLKKLLAEAALDIEVSRRSTEKVVSPQGRRDQVELTCQRGSPLRRACGLIGVARSTLSYEFRMRAKDAPVIEAMRMLLALHAHYGYRRLRIFLRRQGLELSFSSAHRSWQQAGLLFPKTRGRKRIATGRPRASSPLKMNMVWAYDFVFDTTADGRQIICLTVVDEYSWECSTIDVAGAIPFQRGIKVFAQLISIHGTPLFLRSNSGPEFVSHAILECIANAGIGTSVNDPGTPWQNGTYESFIGKFRDECLSFE